MAIIKPNNNTISAITALPAAIPTGRVLQVVSTVKTDTFSTDLKWEPSRGGQDFPHLYRGLLMTEVEWHSAIKKENGCHYLPEAINELI